MRFWAWLLRACTFIAAVIFVLILVDAQIACPIPTCKGPEGDVWMLVFVVTPLGLPALVMSVFFLAKLIWPTSQLVSRAGLWLMYLLFAIIGLAILCPFILGCLDGLKHTSHRVQVHQ